MLAKVTILLEGYTNADQVGETGEERTRPTITLIQDEDLTIVIDPGILEDHKMLIDALEVYGLSLEDVNIVCVTHSHIDHYKNVGMFPNAKVLEYYGLWEGDTVSEWKENLTSNIRILKTPGHDYTGISLFVKTEDGIVAICGDVYWKEYSPADPYDDPYASDPKKLAESRGLVLKLSDWIIPGHGGMFGVKDDRGDTDSSESNLKKSTNGVPVCKNCKKPFAKDQDRCLCRPWLCFRCCQCDLDCQICSCSHKSGRKRVRTR